MKMRDYTCMSMTKMIEENSDRLAPRESRVMLPGQSHISRGMTVLAERGEIRKGKREKNVERTRIDVWSFEM
jgi:hypothetical protein